MHSVRLGLAVLILGAAGSLAAQSSVPTLSQPIPAQALAAGAAPATIDLKNHFIVPGVAGPVVQFDTVFGRFNVELRDDVAPRHAANFLQYVAANTYNNTFFHRSASFDNGAVSIVQGGGYGYKLPFEVFTVTKFPAVALEYNLANARGTLAAARTSDINSATSEWYFNTRDNSSILAPSNGGGYTVFGRVMGTGMTVVDTIAGLTRYNFGGAFGEIPLRNYSSGDPNQNHLVIVNSIRRISLYPADQAASVVEFTAESSNQATATVGVSGSTLSITPVGAGTATITVRAADTNGNAVTGTVAVTVTGSGPAFTAQPVSQNAATGSTVVFNAVATGVSGYRWERNGAEIAGATSGTLVLKNVSAANAGSYVAVAGSLRSAPATLTVADVASLDASRLINLSILTRAGSGVRVLTMGAFVGPGQASSALPLVIRGVGPTLAQPPFNVSGVLPDPVMSLYAAGGTSPLQTSDNWGGGADLAAAFRAVGAFELPAASLDSAIVRNAPGVNAGGYTVQVTGKADASGSVIAEIYDAAGAARTVNTPRLINLSTRAQIDAEQDLAVGFVLGGQGARTVLIRGIGPSLTTFGVTGVMEDPRLELFNNSTNQRIIGNDDWAGDPQLVTVAQSVGAFDLIGPTSKDAVLLVTLPPGAYSARIRGGANFAPGNALVEVYEVP